MKLEAAGSSYELQVEIQTTAKKKQMKSVLRLNFRQKCGSPIKSECTTRQKRIFIQHSQVKELTPRWAF